MTAPPPAMLLRSGGLSRLHETAMGDSSVTHATAGRHIADGVERLIVGHDLEDVTGRRIAEPDAGRYGNSEIGPVLDARHRRTVDELGPRSR